MKLLVMCGHAYPVPLQDMHHYYCGGKLGVCTAMTKFNGDLLKQYLLKVKFTGRTTNVGDHFCDCMSVGVRAREDAMCKYFSLISPLVQFTIQPKRKVQL